MRVVIHRVLKSRMLVWGLVAMCANLAIGLAARANWIDSYAMASIWPAIGFIYFAGIVTAGAAHMESVYRETSLPQMERIASRSALERSLVHYGPILLFGAVLPIAVPALVEYLIARAVGAGERLYTPVYWLEEIVFVIGLCFIGSVMAQVVESRIYATLGSALLSMVLAVFVNPAPPTNYPWQELSIQRLFDVALLLAIGVTGTIVIKHAEERNRKMVGVAALGAICVLAVATSHHDSQSMADGAGKGECRSENGVQVCVWPGDEFAYPQLFRFASAAQEVADELGSDRVNKISEPNLNIEGAVPVDPYDGGDGMWLVAELIAGAATEDSIEEAQCDWASMSKKESDEWTTHSWAADEMATMYVYGGERPRAVVSDKGDLADDVNKETEGFLDLPKDEQLGKIKEELQWLKQC